MIGLKNSSSISFLIFSSLSFDLPSFNSMEVFLILKGYSLQLLLTVLSTS